MVGKCGRKGLVEILVGQDRDGKFLTNRARVVAGGREVVGVGALCELLPEQWLALPRPEEEHADDGHHDKCDCLPGGAYRR